MSSWTDRFSSALDALKGSWGAAFDWSSNPLDVNKDAFDQITDHLGRFFGGISSATNLASAGGGDAILAGLGWSGEQITERASALVTVGSLLESPTWQRQHGVSNSFAGLGQFGEAWNQARDIADTQSFGRSLALAVTTKDILAEQDKIKDLEDNSFLFNAVTGVIDATTSIYTDPTNVVGKVYSAAKKVNQGLNVGLREGDKGWTAFLANAGYGPGYQTADDIAESKAVDRFLEWRKGKTAAQIYNYAPVRKSAYPSVLAGLLADVDDDTARLIIAVAHGSEGAYAKLATQRDQLGDLAQRLARADNKANFAVDAELWKGYEYRKFTPIVIKPKALKGPDDPLFSTPTPDFQPGRKPSVGEAPTTGPLSQDSITGIASAGNASASTKRLIDATSMNPIKGIPEDKTYAAYAKEIDSRLSSPSRAYYNQALRNLDELVAAVGPGGTSPGRGVFASMQDYVIRSERDLKRADRVLAYQWASKSHADEAVIHPAPFGLPVRVIKSVPMAIMRGFSEKRAPSWIDFNRGDSHAAFAAWLSHVDVFTGGSRDIYLRQYMRAFTPQSRRQVINNAEKMALEFLGKKHGIDADKAKILAEAHTGKRDEMLARLQGRDPQYAPPEAFKGMAIDEDGIPVTSPFFETQTPNQMPLIDYQRYKLAYARNSEVLGLIAKGARTGQDWLDKGFDVFSQFWSFSVLMRLGYTVRTLTDDMLRAMASLGAMTMMGGLNAGLKNAFTKSGDYDRSWLRAATSGDLTLTKGAAGARVYNAYKRYAMKGLQAFNDRNIDELRSFIQEVTDKWGRDLKPVRKQGQLGFKYRGKKVTGAYQGPGDVYESIAGGSYDALARTTQELVERLRSDFAAHKTIFPDDREHLAAWSTAVHHQIGKSELAKQFLMGKTADEVTQWLKSAQGLHIRRQIGKNAQDLDALVGQTQAIVDHYVPVLNGHYNPMVLREMALEGRLTPKVLEEFFPDRMWRPAVSGGTIDWNLYQGSVREWFDKIVSNGFKVLGQMPTDRLVRHPTFRILYDQNVKNLIDNQMLMHGHVTGDQLKAFEHVSREKAIGHMNRLLYNVANRSNAAHAMRFFTGFFSAWEDSIKRWAQLSTEKPQILFYGTKIWDAPNEMNFGSTENEFGERVPRFQVVDDLGRQIQRVQLNGRSVFAVKDDNGKWVEFDRGLNENSKIIARLPQWFIDHVPGAEEFGSAGVPKSSLNLIAPGNPWWLPGAGPVATVPISWMAERHPTTFNSVYKWAIPFGAQDYQDVLLPPWLKSAMQSNAGVEDPSYSYMYLQNMLTEEMRIRHGKRERPSSAAAFDREIRDRTDAAYKLRTFTRFFLPFTVDLQSPYRMYIDKYREMRDMYGDDADDRFYERYGDDLYQFTTALSKNNIGAAPTAAAWDAVEEHKDAIAEHPEYGALILGPEANTGDYNQYVYDAQFSQKLRAGSKLTAREHQSPVDAIKENNVRLGWTKWRAWSQQLQAAAVEYGLTPDEVSKVRGVLASNLGSKNPDWDMDYSVKDEDAMRHRIAFMENLVSDQKLVAQRPEFQVLADYLAVRRQFASILTDLKRQQLPYTLDAQANADLADRWNAIQHAFELSDTRFGDLFSRYLTNDRVQI